jgi:hypothetical protein
MIWHHEMSQSAGVSLQIVCNLKVLEMQIHFMSNECKIEETQKIMQQIQTECSNKLIEESRQ